MISPAQRDHDHPRDGKNGPGLNVHDYVLERGEKTALEGSGGITMTLTDMSPDVEIGPNGQLMAQSDQFRGRGVGHPEL